MLQPPLLQETLLRKGLEKGSLTAPKSHRELETELTHGETACLHSSQQLCAPPTPLPHVGGPSCPAYATGRLLGHWFKKVPQACVLAESGK